MKQNVSEHVRAQINNWLTTVDYNDFYKAIECRIIGQPNLKIVVANVYNYLSNIVAGRPVNNNMLLTAPSGSGKTETYRALRDYFKDEIPDMPIYSFDTSLLTASGYKGAEPYEICAPFFQMEMEDAIGICFLDEFDKKLTPSYNMQGLDTNAEAQANMLTIVEGTLLNGRGGLSVVNTSNIMFVGLGSFDDFRKTRENDSKSLGFKANDITEITEHYAPVSRDAMIESGGSFELIGRFPIIVNYQKLAPEHIRMIINKLIGEIEDSFDCEITLTQEMFDKLFEVSNSNFGCRTFDSMIRTATLNAYSLAISVKIPNRVLSVTIHTPDTSSFVWREYTEAEQLEYEAYQSFLQIMKESDSKKDKNNKYNAIDVIQLEP